MYDGRGVYALPSILDIVDRDSSQQRERLYNYTISQPGKGSVGNISSFIMCITPLVATISGFTTRTSLNPDIRSKITPLI